MTDYTEYLVAIESAVAALRTALMSAPPEVDQIVQGVLAGLKALPQPAPSGTPAPAPIPADTNAYPLSMPSGIAAGAPVDIGTGPDTIDILMSNALDATKPDSNFAVLMDGKAIAGPLTCTSRGGLDKTKSQHFITRGSWGPSPHTIGIVQAGAGFAEYALNAMSYDLVPCYFNGVADSRGNASVNATHIINTNGSNTFWTTEPSTATGGAGVPTGGAAGDPTMQAMIAATPAGGLLTLANGVIKGVAKIDHPITIQGAGLGQTLIDVTGLALAGPNRGAFAPIVPGCLFKGMSIKGAHYSDNTAAGIEAIAGADFQADQIEITDCNDGIRTGAINATLNGVWLHGNGAGDSRSHNAYFSNAGTAVSKVLNVGDSKFELANMGHELKSRLGTTNVTNTEFTARDGACINCPDGGVLNVTGGIMRKPAGSIDQKVIDFGRELVKESAADQAAYIALGMVANLADVFIDNQTEKAVVLQGEGRSTLNLTNVTSNGDVETLGWLAVTGQVTKV